MFVVRECMDNHDATIIKTDHELFQYLYAKVLNSVDVENEIEVWPIEHSKRMEITFDLVVAGVND